VVFDFESHLRNRCHHFSLVASICFDAFSEVMVTNLPDLS
jgi:hypothetical protein